MNRGDSRYISLAIRVNGKLIDETYSDDIELTINPQSAQSCVQKTLKNGEIVWNNTLKRYVAFISQNDSFRLKNGSNNWQVRLLKGEVVVSTTFGSLEVGPVNSREILE